MKKAMPIESGDFETRHTTHKYPAYGNIHIHDIGPTCETNPSSPLFGQRIVFTGELSIRREDAMQLAVDAGALLQSTVSGRTNILVVGKQNIALVGADGMSSKEEKAYALNQAGKANITILDEEQFFALIPQLDVCAGGVK